ncbi:hypothetical protein [Calditerrivibrio nitroreducens]|uniref:Uncharacterized protein n=1 Tax=Calditerrivibrio nitroreducens (strain DSM 19672 / NBRC 101217 / Yu37-1) TaxID=768670 RepID=E4THY2_CALNY|nr:hypothetical protein [Calditerrivibrio nitroreducens]ADR18912.1 hypothetical protein Calni_1001 [Calditerrivibrio nitroreducens DSM 19672]
MNYKVFIIGQNRELINLIMKLFLITAKEADYAVKVESSLPENLFEPIYYIVYLKGSEKNSFKEIVLDLDDMSAIENKDFSPSKLMINRDKNALHYWYIFGNLFRSIEDLNPAYVTGYLLEQKKELELKYFRSA